MELIKGWIKRLLPNSMLMAYRNYRETKIIRIPEENCLLGFRFSGNLTMANGNFEIDETAIIKSELAVTDVFVNIGANIGYYCKR